MDYIMTLSKPSVRAKFVYPIIKIPKAQISIIKTLLNAYVYKSGNDASLL